MPAVPHVIQLLPHRRSPSEGVGDYAVGLARQFRQAGTETIFVAAPLIEGWGAASDEFETIYTSVRSATALLSAIAEAQDRFPAENGMRNAAPVLLHWSAYGFQKRAVPFWIVNALRRHDAVLATIFHELFASSSPRRSAFWFSPLQRHLARTVLRLSDMAMTTNDQYGRQLKAWDTGGSHSIAVIPVCSNVGEPAVFIPFDQRKSAAVVFGSAGLRAEFYRRAKTQISDLVEKLGISRIHDIGARSSAIPDAVGGAVVEQHGFLEAGAISRIMCGSRFAFLDYPRATLGKSTLFAAHAAHGLATFVWDDAGSPSGEGLVEGRHFLSPSQHAMLPGDDDLARTGERLFGWYQRHRSAIAADMILEQLTQAASAGATTNGPRAASQC